MDKIELKEFGANLQAKRKERGLSLEQLSHLCEMDTRQISKIEKGQTDIRITTAMRLMWALDIEANDLFPKK